MAKNSKSISKDACFVIMPISDCDGYDDGHFSKVYEDIFKPACVTAGFVPVRADEVKQTNLIHLDILQNLIDSPMAICDLSSRNPNVLFELGLRQAFDKPTVLVQEKGTPKIFDIAPLRYTEYRKELKYREVLDDQKLIAEAITETKKACAAGEGVNSIVNILSLAGPASLKDVGEADTSRMLQLVRAEMSEMRSDFRRAINNVDLRNNDSVRGISHKSYARRIREARLYHEEVKSLIEIGAPKEVIMKMISKAQEVLIRLINSETPDEYGNEARRLFMMCEKQEQLLLEKE